MSTTPEATQNTNNRLRRNAFIAGSVAVAGTLLATVGVNAHNQVKEFDTTGQISTDSMLDVYTAPLAQGIVNIRNQKILFEHGQINPLELDLDEPLPQLPDDLAPLVGNDDPRFEDPGITHP